MKQTRNRRARVKAALPWLVACAWSAGWAHADPMRPLVPSPAASSAAPALAAAPDRSARSRDPDTPREADRLVAIRQDSASRWLALFGERWLGVGDRLDSYTVASIEANTVELAEGRQRRTLHLLPPLWRPGPPGQPVPGPEPGLPSKPPPRISARPGLAKSPGPPTALAQAGSAVLSPQPLNGLSTP